MQPRGTSIMSFALGLVYAWQCTSNTMLNELAWQRELCTVSQLGHSRMDFLDIFLAYCLLLQPRQCYLSEYINMISYDIYILVCLCNDHFPQLAGLMPFRGHNIAIVLFTRKNWLSMHDHVWQRLAHEKLVSFQLHGSHISQYCIWYQLSFNTS